MSPRANERSQLEVRGVDRDEVSRRRPGAPVGALDAGVAWQERACRRGAPVCVQVFVLSRRMRCLGCRIGRELEPVRASRVAVSGGARTK